MKVVEPNKDDIQPVDPHQVWWTALGPDKISPFQCNLVDLNVLIVIEFIHKSVLFILIKFNIIVNNMHNNDKQLVYHIYHVCKNPLHGKSKMVDGQRNLV